MRYNRREREGLPWDQLLSTNKERVDQTQALRKLLRAWQTQQNQEIQDVDIKELLLRYASHLQNMNSPTSLESSLSTLSIRNEEDLRSIHSERDVYLSCDLIDRSSWKPNFSRKFLNKLNNLSIELVRNIFARAYIYCEGYLPFYATEDIALRLIDYPNSKKKYYLTKFDEDCEEESELLISISIHKVPIFSMTNEAIIKFQFQTYIQFEEILAAEIIFKEKKLEEILSQINKETENNPRFDYHKKELSIRDNLDKKVCFYNPKVSRQISYEIQKIQPIPYKDPKFAKIEIDNYSYLLKRFNFLRDRQDYLNSRADEVQQVNSKEMKENDKERLRHQRQIAKFERQLSEAQKMNFKSAGKIVTFLEKIPNFKYKLTNQQRALLAENGNLIVVGRSGTGKTTCAMLRLYGIEYIQRMKEVNTLAKNPIVAQEKCKMALFQQTFTSKNIFLTQSPYLIQQIKKQYDDMMNQIKENHAQKCEKCKKQIRKDKQELVEQDELDKQRKMLESQEKRAVSLQLLEKYDFPGFFMVFSFLKMIDRTISRPFFDHEEEKYKKPQKKKIIESYVNVYTYSQNIQKNLKPILFKFVNYDFFNELIWEKLPHELTKFNQQTTILTPSVVWSEIFSILKGSIKAHTSPEGMISLKMYFDQPRNIFQNYEAEQVIQLKTKIYEIFKVYQNICKFEHHYDMMDIANHLLREIEFFGYSGPKMNSIFIDEVQDLTPATILLLSKMVANNIFYCGDTAQAITKGVDFRFQDLKFIFNREYCQNYVKIDPPSEPIYLTVNFRSHNLILQLANSVISSLEELFPMSITKIKKKERSDLFGPKPFVIFDRNDLLLDLLCGQKSSPLMVTRKVEKVRIINKIREQKSEIERQEEQINEMQQSEMKEQMNQDQFDQQSQEEEQIQQQCQYQQIAQIYYQEQLVEEQYVEKRRFHTQQVTIVRNAEERDKLPKYLQDSLVLTPETVKGLEYDEIILYNFFSSSNCFDKWSILDYLDVEEWFEDAAQFQQKLSRRDQEETGKTEQISIILKELLEYDFDKKQYKNRQIKKKSSLNEKNLNHYFEMVNQLKLFYTMVTRARSVFVIFDSKIPKSLLRLWEKMKLVTIIDDNNVKGNHKDIDSYNKREGHVRYLNEAKLWMKQGTLMLNRREYKEAITCFKRIDRIDLVERVQAEELQSKADNERYRIETELKKIEKLGVQRNKKRAKLNRQISENNLMFRKAAETFEKYKRFEEAGNAYFKGEYYSQALQCFLVIGDNQRSSSCCMKLGLYDRAIELYSNKKQIDKLVQCYRAAGKWCDLFSLYITNYSNLSVITTEQQRIECVYHYLQGIVTKKISLFNTKDEKKQSVLIGHQGNIKEFYDPNQLQKQAFVCIQSITYMELKKMYEGTLKRYKQSDAKIENLKRQITDLKLSMKKSEDYFSKIKQNSKHHQNAVIKHNNQVNQLCIAKNQLIYQLNSKFYSYSKEDVADIQNQLKQLDIKLLEITKIAIALNQQSAVINQRYLFHEKELPELQSILNKKNKELQKLIQITKSKKITALLTSLRQQLEKKIEENIIKFKESQLNAYKKKKISNQIADDDIKANEDYIRSQQYSLIDDDMKQASYITHFEQILSIQKNWMNLKDTEDQQVVLEVITSQLETAERMIIFTNNSYNSPEHHRYMEQKICKQLQDDGHKEPIKLLKKCDFIGQIPSCLLICNFYPALVPLSLRYIFGYASTFSYNHSQDRERARNLKYQFQQNKISQAHRVNNFLFSIKAQTFKHKVPRQGLSNTFYSISLINQIVPGLILQGFYKQALIFCSLQTACKISYLFSDRLSFATVIKQLGKGEHKSIQSNYPFAKAPLITKYPCAQLLNVLSFQDMCFVFDQCQDQPYLSISKKQIFIDIQMNLDLQVYQRIENFEVTRRIEELKSKYNQIYETINQCRDYIQFYKNYEQANLTDNREELFNKKKQAQREKRKSQKIIRQLKESFQFLKQQETASKLSKKQKTTFQQRIRDKSFNISKLREMEAPQEAVQKVEQQRLAIQTEYQQKLALEKSMSQRYEEADRSLKSHEQLQRYYFTEIGKINKELKAYETRSRSVKSENERKEICRYIQYYEQEILKLMKAIPSELSLKDQSQLRDHVKHQLLYQEKEKIYLNKKLAFLKDQLALIQYSTDFLKKYPFLKIHIESKTKYQSWNSRQLNQKVGLSYYKVLEQGINIDKIVKQKGCEEKLCTIILFYLNFVFSKTFQEDSIKFMEQILPIYEKGTNILQTNQKNIQFIEQRLKKFEKMVKLQKKNTAIKQESKQQMFHIKTKLEMLYFQKSCLITLNYHPINLLKKFIYIVSERIRAYSEHEKVILQILFGFYQCKAIKDCPPLDLFGREYALVSANSIVIEKLKAENANFCYFFNQDNTTILCLLEDVERIILSMIDKAHKQMCEQLPGITDTTFKIDKTKKYVEKNTNILAGTKRKDLQSYDEFILAGTYNEDKIKRLYNSEFIREESLIRVKKTKKRLLEYYLETELQGNTQAFHFVFHQLREYEFIQKNYNQMSKFNVKLLDSLAEKIDCLERQFKKWMGLVSGNSNKQT